VPAQTFGGAVVRREDTVKQMNIRWSWDDNGFRQR